MTDDCDSANAVKAVREAHDWYGIPTFVVGLLATSSAADTTLSQMAVSGGFPRPTTPTYYTASTTDELGKVLANISSANASCIFETDLNLHLEKVRGVTANGIPLPLGSFQLVGGNSLQLVGQACADYLGGTLSNIEIQLACGLVW